jgi:hypothetical protein
MKELTTADANVVPISMSSFCSENFLLRTKHVGVEVCGIRIVFQLHICTETAVRPLISSSFTCYAEANTDDPT